MGQMRHHSIVVTSDDSDIIKLVHKKAVSLFEHLVSPIIRSRANGFQSFFIAPDGSKEGWETSSKHDTNRKKYINYLNTFGLAILYCEFHFGSDISPKAELIHFN
jgi:hypothetical protein